MSFAEVRPYQSGDDVRSIDWNVTARKRAPYIKVFEEERELTLFLVIDISNSIQFGTSERSKRDSLTEIAATLAFMQWVIMIRLASYCLLERLRK